MLVWSLGVEVIVYCSLADWEVWVIVTVNYSAIKLKLVIRHIILPQISTRVGAQLTSRSNICRPILKQHNRWPFGRIALCVAQLASHEALCMGREREGERVEVVVKVEVKTSLNAWHCGGGGGMVLELSPFAFGLRANL